MKNKSLLEGKDCDKNADFFEVILDNIPVSIITIDRNGYITSANKYFRNFSRIKDYHHHNIFTGDFFIKENLVDDFKKLLVEGGVFRRDNCFEINSLGEEKYMRIIAVPFKNCNGKIEGIVSLASDNTEAIKFKNELLELNKCLEEKVKQRTEVLDRTNQELSKVLELKSIFIADISHEFRTSLTIMQCGLELLAKSVEIKGKNLDLFNNTLGEIKRVANTLTDLIHLNKDDSSSIKNKAEKVNLNILIKTVCNSLKVVAKDKRVKIKFVESKPAIQLFVIEEEIEKLVSNLIRNAIKYNKEDGWIKIWLEKTYKGIYLKVEDSGIGIAKEEIPNIFERFYRVDKARTRNGTDSGLGLAICKHVAEMHGGNISVTSKLGEGSTFSVYLPENLEN